MAGLIGQAMQGGEQSQSGGQQAQPSQAQPQAPHIQLALKAGHLLYDEALQEAVRSKIMADGVVDEDEAAELAVNLLNGGVEQMQADGTQVSRDEITAALAMIVLLVGQYAETIGGVPQGQGNALAKSALPAAAAIFRQKNGAVQSESPTEESAEPVQEIPQQEQQEMMP